MELTTNLQNIEGREDNFDDTHDYYGDMVKWAANNPGKVIGLDADTYDHSSGTHFAVDTPEGYYVHFAPAIKKGPSGKTTRRDVVWGMQVPLRPDEGEEFGNEYYPVWHFARLGQERLSPETYQALMEHIQNTEPVMIEIPGEAMSELSESHVPA